jgi:hypothetical protein
VRSPAQATGCESPWFTLQQLCSQETGKEQELKCSPLWSTHAFIMHLCYFHFSLVRVVSIMGYGLDDRGSSSGRGRDYCIRYHFQTGSGARLASYPMGIGNTFLWYKWPKSKAEQSPPFNADVKNMWSSTSIQPYVFMALCLTKHGATFPSPITLISIYLRCRVNHLYCRAT